MRKCFALLIILLLAVSSLIMIKPACAQAPTPSTMPKPSVPEFTLLSINSSYTQEANYIQNESIIVSIKNQPFTPYYVEVYSVDLFYEIRWKSHSTSDSWTNSSYSTWVVASNCERGANQELLHANVTITYFVFSTNNCTDNFGKDGSSYHLALPDVSDGGQIDFQVQGHIGYYSDATFYGGSSNWSNTQTITIPTTSSLTATPSVPEFPSPTLIITFLITATLLGTVVIKRKQFRRG